MHENYCKFKTIPHLPNSPGFDPENNKDDSILLTFDNFKNKNIVITEKIDGESSSMYCDYIHARSIDSKHHESRSWVKNLHADIKFKIPYEYRICGENVYAKHSIHYTDLSSYFYVFAIYNEENICLSWDETVDLAETIGLKTVPVLYRGKFDVLQLFRFCDSAHESFFGVEREGFVIRSADRFSDDEFKTNIAKWVREGHVQTDEHWLYKPIVKNILKK